MVQKIIMIWEVKKTNLRNDMSYPDLPLSWFIIDNKLPDYKIKIKLGNNLTWLAIEGIKNPESWFEDTIICSKDKLLLRGIGNSLNQLLRVNSYTSYETGKEAVLTLSQNLKWKKSVKELAKRGKRNSVFEEIPYSDENVGRLNELRKNSRHSSAPELKYLFNNTFIPCMRLFVVKDNCEVWQGALLISKNNNHKYHSELLLKRKRSAAGIMEFLVTKTAEILQSEKINEFSLGEVPFISINLDNKLLNLLIHLFRPILKLSYNFSGLYFFKNKFNPTWHPVYLCSSKNISLFTLFRLSIRTNFLRLIIHKIYVRIKYFFILSNLF